jgi:hypothetical protein
MYFKFRGENPFISGNVAFKIGGKAINYLSSPALPLLARQEIAPDLPIENHQFAVDC